MSEYVYWSNGTPLASAGGEISLPRERITRCADCGYYHDGKNTDGKRYVEPHCLAIGGLAFGALYEVGEHDFCSRAERKVD